MIVFIKRFLLLVCLVIHPSWLSAAKPADEPVTVLSFPYGTVKESKAMQGAVVALKAVKEFVAERDALIAAQHALKIREMQEQMDKERAANKILLQNQETKIMVSTALAAQLKAELQFTNLKLKFERYRIASAFNIQIPYMDQVNDIVDEVYESELARQEAIIARQKEINEQQEDIIEQYEFMLDDLRASSNSRNQAMEKIIDLQNAEKLSQKAVRRAVNQRKPVKRK